VKKLVVLFLLILVSTTTAPSQTATVARNVNLRPDPSTNQDAITKLAAGVKVELLEAKPVRGYYHVQTADGKTGFVWGRNIRNLAAATTPSASKLATATSAHVAELGQPMPLLAAGHPVDWWFVFKFNAASFPGCDRGAERTCVFGGQVQSSWRSFSQQFAVASSEAKNLRAGSGCVGDTMDDPVGATFGEIYDGTFSYVVWNDQFYQDPQLAACGSSNSCLAPWGHSKGVVAWDETGEGIVMQVTTPDWPGAASRQHPRAEEGNTLGCTARDNDVLVSQHFFALKLTKSDVVKVLTALQNASVVTDPHNTQIVKSGGPADIGALVASLGVKSASTAVTHETLSTGVQLISKPSGLHAPPWQMVSSVLDGISLRAATWWTNPGEIPSTTSATAIDCWSTALGAPGGVEIATSGQFQGKTFGLKGVAKPDGNHAKIGVSTSGSHHYAIFGDMNQEGALKENCDSSQNGRGGLFFVIDDEELSNSVKDLITGGSAPIER
jgi:Deoxyribonuclease II/Bacterial SH3 domain